MADDESPWRPLSVRHDPDVAAEYDGPHEGVPVWLRDSLWAWVERQLTQESIPRHRRVVDQDLLLRLQRRLRLQIDGTDLRSLADSMESPDVFLDVVDFLASVKGDRRELELLEDLLREGGSAWRVNVSGARVCLERRVDETTQELADALTSAQNNPSQHLRAAWCAIYGRHPDPGKGYWEAVKAVEAAAKPVVLPEGKPTLGTMIKAMGDKPSKWRLSFEIHDVPQEEQIGRVIGMLDSLWRGHVFDRHGTDEQVKEVTQEAAEAAIHLAVPLVHWFTNGVVRRA